MIIDPSKVNLSEKDIENYLFAHPEAVAFRYGKIERWIKRQFQIPSGIIDLLGVSTNGHLVLVEIKNTPIEATALTQICRYAHDLNHAIGDLALDILHDDCPWPELSKLVIGKSIETKVFREAEALDVMVMTFDVEFRMNLSGVIHWNEDFRNERKEQYRRLAIDPDLVAAIQEYNQGYLDFQARHAEAAESPDDTIGNEVTEVADGPQNA